MKASTYKYSGRPLSGGKALGLDSAICFYEIEDSDTDEELEESGILIIHDKSLVTTKQNLVKRKFPYIDTFIRQVTAVVRKMV